MALSRRDFLARSGAALAGWGLAEAIAVDRMAQVLAEPGGQRRALLIGINAYEPATIARSATDVALEGCLTDVALLQEVLVSRLGFGAADVVVLTDRAASRSNWQAALDDLLGSVRTTDAVAFHFSGYGGQLADGTSVLVPVDGQVVQDPAAIVRDWSEDTLQGWLRSLPTERAIGIVDAGSAVALPGQWLRQRSRPALTIGRLDPAELAWQQTLQRGRSGRSASAAGLWLRATTPDRPAIELPQAGFVAGAFTYALVQRLWAVLPARTLWFDLAIAAATVEGQVGARQRPIGQRLGAAATNDPQPDQWLNPSAGLSCGAILTSDPTSNSVEVTLAGLGPTVLETVAPGSILETIGQPAIGLRVLSRTGWRAIAQPIADDPPGRAIDWTTLEPGQLLRERWRVLPRNLELNVALDPTFERIERIDATSAFDAVSQVTVVAPGTKAINVWFARSPRAAGGRPRDVPPVDRPPNPDPKLNPKLDSPLKPNPDPKLDLKPEPK
ncbi:MAG TPA: caspase family protein, partial [Coleofasciculaceae cyanobacterium]